MTVGLHGQSAAVLMAKPPGNGRDIDTTFDTDCRKKVPQVVMGDPRHADYGSGAVPLLAKEAAHSPQPALVIFRTSRAANSGQLLKREADISLQYFRVRVLMLTFLSSR